MKKEKQIKTHQRRTKGGKTVVVRAHKAKYDAAEELKKMSKKKGAGDELESRKKQAPTETPNLGFTDAEFKEWYHWDQEGDPKNKTALKVEKALIAKMGKRAYTKYFNDLSDSYSARGHSKAYKSLVAEHAETPTPKTPKTPKAAKTDVPKELVGNPHHPAWKEFDASWEKTQNAFLRKHGMHLTEKQQQRLDDMYEKAEKKFIEDYKKKSEKASKDAPVETEVTYKGKKVKAIDFGSLSAKEEKTPSKRLSPKETDDFLSGKQGAVNPQPKERTSWGHTSREKGKAVRPLDMRGQANYSGITSSGLKLPKKFTYDSDTRSDWYDSFRTKDSAAIENVVSQAKKAKWKKGGSGKMVRYTSPDGRVHILVNKGDKSASVFYR